METTQEIDAAEVYEPESNGYDQGYGDEQLAEPADGYDEYESEQDRALAEQEQALEAKIGIDGDDVAEALVTGPEAEEFVGEDGNTYVQDEEGDYLPIDLETGQVVGDWYIDGHTREVGEFEDDGEPELFSDDAGNVYAEDDEGDFIPVDENGEEVGDFYIDGETGEIGGYEDDEDDQPFDPRVDALIEHLAEREDEEAMQAFYAWQDANPVVEEPAVKRALVGRVIELAQNAGNPDLALDPSYLDAALAAVLRERATPSNAEQARHQGAPLETDAGAMKGSTPSYEDQAWEEIKGSAGTAFTS